MPFLFKKPPYSLRAQLMISYMLLFFFIFLIKGKQGNDNWSDGIFYDEFISLSLMNAALIIFYRRLLLYKKSIFPWLGALLAACLIISYVYIAERQDSQYYSEKLYDIVTQLPSYGAEHLHFFGLLEVAPPPGGLSTRAAFLDTQICHAAGYVLGFIVEKSVSKRSVAG